MRIVWVTVTNLLLRKANIFPASTRAEFSANVNINYLFSAQQAANKFHRHRARHAHCCFTPWLGLQESTFISLNIAWAVHCEANKFRNNFLNVKFVKSFPSNFPSEVGSLSHAWDLPARTIRGEEAAPSPPAVQLEGVKLKKLHDCF